MKFSYRLRLMLIAFLLVLSTLFTSCDLLGGSDATTTTQEATVTTAPSTEDSSSDETSSAPNDDEQEDTSFVGDVPSDGTTTEPKETSSQPDDTSSKPDDTSSKPDDTSSKPDDTSSQPDDTSSQPDDNTPNEDPPSGEHYPGIPAFSGEKYVEVNGNIPYFTQNDYTTTSYEQYSPLDALGRCGVAMACLGRDLMPTGTRGSLSVNPSGWVQATYDIVDAGYLYNRSHLIGWQLAGEDNNKLNLITGTQFFNQRGMLPFENMVADYIKETDNHVLYRVTPLFVENELVARGVLIEAWSVEDNGDGICFNVFVYNVQPGIIIDYATGESRLEKEDTTTPTPDQSQECDYIANKTSKKFHDPDCSSVSKMSEANKEYYTATREEMIAMGYSPCGTCKP